MRESPGRVRHPCQARVGRVPEGFPRDLSAPAPGGSRVAGLTCSARDCRAEARWGLRWNNPRLHAPDRRKVWLACDEHRATLGQYLDVRGFLRETLPVADLPADD